MHTIPTSTGMASKVCDILSQQYFNIDAEEVFYICDRDLQPLRNAVWEMIEELKNGDTS